MNTIELIMKCASVPSFSSYENRLHPFIEEVAQEVEGTEILKVKMNNMVIKVPGKRDHTPIALTAHLDKINHFGEDIQTAIPIKSHVTFLEGQLDDAVGVGICLSVMLESQKQNFPPLLILFSEVEESYGLRKHPHLLQNNGEGLSPRIGARRIAKYLVQSDSVPSLALTVDTTPFFKGEEGIALYCNHWELTELTPSAELIASTQNLQQKFLKIHPKLKLLNNVNDYLKYGEIFNKDRNVPVPSLAIEPAIFPYHTIGERVFIKDIEKVVEIIITFLRDS